MKRTKIQYIKPRLVLFCLFSFNLHGDIPESLYSLNTQLEKIANSIKPSKSQVLPSQQSPAKEIQAESAEKKRAASTTSKRKNHSSATKTSFC